MAAHIETSCQRAEPRQRGSLEPVQRPTTPAPAWTAPSAMYDADLLIEVAGRSIRLEKMPVFTRSSRN